jgi:hypothetical protein
MKFVNRGYIIVRPKKAFIEWANANDEDYNDLTENEPSVYLIEEDFYDDEVVLKANFKKIFTNELLSVSEDDSTFPEITYEIFNDWFEVEMGSTVFDSQNDSLKAD